MTPEEGGVPPRDDEESVAVPGGDGDGAGNGDPAGPPPSTWAGRQRRAEDGDGAEAAAEEPDEGPPGEARSGETVEVDTLALADREEAQEAALAGLRARTAAHGPRADQRPITAAPPAPPSPAAPPPQAPAPPKAPTPMTPAVSAPEPPDEGVGKAPKGRTWVRFVVGAILIVVSVATATAVSGVVLAWNVAQGLGGLGKVQHLLSDSDASGSQTILILGSDKRPGEGDHGRSDTTILLRLTPSAINLLSIPRDLKVNIPGVGTDKFNAAYTYGGVPLTTKVVQQLTGLPINHVINIDFTGFADAVDSIGCVYYDVDRHYYHSNAGLPYFEQYAEIDIPAGYQRMCGFKALQFVRYRHDDSDIVREARQQAFLREARHQVPATELASDYPSLAKIFGKYTSSDPGLRDTGNVIGLARLLVEARSAPVRQIHFPARFGTSYVYASHHAIHHAVQQFLGNTQSTPAPSSSANGSGAGSKNGGGGSKHSGGGGSAPAPPPLIDSTASGQQYAAKLDNARWRKEGKIPILYPTKLVPGSFLTQDSDSYRIDGPGDAIYDGYTFVAEIPAGTAGYGYSAYYDFTGTNWHDPPILDDPTATKTINGHEFELFWDKGRLRLVGWKTDKGSYWVDNDLLETLTPGQMVAMAEAVRPHTA